MLYNYDDELLYFIYMYSCQLCGQFLQTITIQL